MKKQIVAFMFCVAAVYSIPAPEITPIEDEATSSSNSGIATQAFNEYAETDSTTSNSLDEEIVWKRADRECVRNERIRLNGNIDKKSGLSISNLIPKKHFGLVRFGHTSLPLFTITPNEGNYTLWYGTQDENIPLATITKEKDSATIASPALGKVKVDYTGFNLLHYKFKVYKNDQKSDKNKHLYNMQCRHILGKATTFMRSNCKLEETLSGVDVTEWSQGAIRNVRDYVGDGLYKIDRDVQKNIKNAHGIGCTMQTVLLALATSSSFY